MLSQLLVNGLIAGSVYALVAIGFGLIFATTRFFHFAHGAIYTAGAYLTYLFTVVLSFPFFIALILAISLTAFLGGLIEIGIYRPLRQKKVSRMVLLLVSLGLFVVIQNSISLLFGDDTKSIRSGIVTEGLLAFGARITPIQVVIILVSLVLCLLTWAALRFTNIGGKVRAVANDPELAKIVGVHSDRTILLTFIVGSAMAAVAAILAALDTDMTPTMGFNALLMGVVAVIVGGIGSVPGAVLGGLLIGFAQHLGVWRLPTQWQDAIVFAILILFLLLRPQGILGKPLRKAAI